MTIAFSQAHSRRFKRGRSHNVDRVVLHSTDLDIPQPIEEHYAFYVDRLSGDSNNTSPHFVVHRTGETAQAVSLRDTAYHAGGWNDRSVGIEMVHYDEGEELQGAKAPAMDWPDAQVRQVSLILALLRVHRGLRIDLQDGTQGTVISHASISTKGKTDPKRFPWDGLKQFYREELVAVLDRRRREFVMGEARLPGFEFS